jgi:predicted ATPase/DNA-binding winged helix-turn-helix (wHTH) protein
LSGFSFRRFQVLLDHRELLADGAPVRIGARAFDVLVALLEARGLIVPKDRLLKRVWGSTHVEANSVEAQVAAVRNALGPDRDAVVTLPGRGYRLDAGVVPLPMGLDSAGAAPDAAVHVLTNLPAAISSFVGREVEGEQLVSLVAANRLVTLSGPGGIGKTRLGLECARRVLPTFRDGVWMVELARVVEAGSIVGAVAAGLNLPPHQRPSTDSLIAFLRSKQLLLILDNCEHLVGDVAILSEALLKAAPQLRILATSQEGLGVEGEHLYRLQPLDIPLGDQARETMAATAAVQLFAERFRSAAGGVEIDASAIGQAADICRRLDGIPLAIELAAARAATFGVAELAGGLDGRLRLLTQGRRTAPPRHKSLEAILDWSHALLADPERTVFRRISVFRGDFSLSAACCVAGLDEAVAETALAGLVAKSLLISSAGSGSCRFSLLETTRLYAEEKLRQAGEAQAIARRHAGHFLKRLTQTSDPWDNVGRDDWLALHAPERDQVRAALDWALSPDGDPAVAIDLALAAAALWARLSLFGEVERYARRILACEGAVLTPRQEMELLCALSMSIVPIRARAAEKAAIAETALDLARRLGDAEHEARLLLTLQRAHCWDADAAEVHVQSFLRLAEAREHHADLLVGRSIAAGFCWKTGALARAQALIEPLARSSPSLSDTLQPVRFGFAGRIMAMSNCALILWLRGRPDEALRMVAQSVRQADRPDQMVSSFSALCNGVLIARLSGDLALAGGYADHLCDLVHRQGLGFGHGDAQVLKAASLSPVPLESMGAALGDLGELWPGHLVGLYKGWFAQGLGDAGRRSEARDVIEAAIAQSGRTDAWFMPELLRIKAQLLERGSADGAEPVYLEALRTACSQGALGWELRAALGLAELWKRQGRADEALDLLVPLCARFADGAAGADVRRAADLIGDLRGPPGREDGMAAIVGLNAPAPALASAI